MPALIAKRLHRFCLGRPCRIIPSGGKPYLVRVYLRHWADGSRTYLHRFVSRDAERWVHDHPFDGKSLVLSGSYVEEVLHTLSADPVRYRRRWCNAVPAHKLHRIVDVEPDTWTLFHHGPHRHRWGFLEPIDTEDGSIAMLYHNPFDQGDSAGAHWWAKPGVAVYPPEGC